MSQQNIDFGSFPNDPSADSIQTAFQKANTNFSQLFAASTSTAVTSINRTPGAGITVNQSTGNVVLSASIACVQVATSSLSIGRNSNGGTSASITQSSSQTLVIDINPDTVRSNSFAAVGGGLAIFNGTLSTTSNAQPNVTSLGNLLVANVTGNVIAGNISANANISANVVSGNTVTANVYVMTVATTISANGTTQAEATPLTKSFNVVSSVSTNQGVSLPTATAGMSIYITNTSANTLKIYPATGASINTESANASVNLSSNVTVQFIAPTATQWYSVGNLA